MRYEDAFRVSAWVTIVWAVSVIFFIALALVTDWTVGHGGVYVYTVLWPAFLICGLSMCILNVLFAFKGVKTDRSLFRVTVFASVIALVVPQLFVIALPY